MSSSAEEKAARKGQRHRHGRTRSCPNIWVGLRGACVIVTYLLPKPFYLLAVLAPYRSHYHALAQPRSQGASPGGPPPAPRQTCAPACGAGGTKYHRAKRQGRAWLRGHFPYNEFTISRCAQGHIGLAPGAQCPVPP